MKEGRTPSLAKPGRAIKARPRVEGSPRARRASHGPAAPRARRSHPAVRVGLTASRRRLVSSQIRGAGRAAIDAVFPPYHPRQVRCLPRHRAVRDCSICPCATWRVTINCKAPAGGAAPALIFARPAGSALFSAHESGCSRRALTPAYLSIERQDYAALHRHPPHFFSALTAAFNHICVCCLSKETPTSAQKCRRHQILAWRVVYSIPFYAAPARQNTL